MFDALQVSGRKLNRNDQNKQQINDFKSVLYTNK
jgi:hypothetical protein